MIRRANNLTYRNVILSEAAYGGLPAHLWMLDETNGTNAVDLMAIAGGSGVTGTYTGGYTQGATGPINREASRAVTLNGSTGCVSLGANNIALAGSFTWEAWIRTGSPSSEQMIAARDVSGARQFIFAVSNGGAAGSINLTRGNSSGSLTGLSSGTVVTANTWTHVVGVYVTSSGTISLYAQGVSVAGGTFGSQGAVGPNTADLRIGARTFSGFNDFFNGSIAIVAQYDYALDADRINYHYLSGINGVFNG